MLSAICVQNSGHVYEGEQRILVGLNLPNSETHLRQTGITNVASNEALKLNVLAQVLLCQ